MKFGTLFLAGGINANSDNTSTLANVNWEALAAQRIESVATCAARVNWRFQFLDDSIYHMCMMDTSLYMDDHLFDGTTSYFSRKKINDIVAIYGGNSNDLVFGYPTHDCGCFPGCDDFKVKMGHSNEYTHITNFCCSDWEAECVSPPNARDALNKAIQDADDFMKNMDTVTIGPKRKLTRFERKLSRNIGPDGNVICAGQEAADHEQDHHEDGDHERLHGGQATIINPEAAHIISDRLWHIVDHYFRDCNLVRHHFNRANRFGNALQKALRR